MHDINWLVFQQQREIEQLKRWAAQTFRSKKPAPIREMSEHLSHPHFKTLQQCGHTIAEQTEQRKEKDTIYVEDTIDTTVRHNARHIYQWKSPSSLEIPRGRPNRNKLQPRGSQMLLSI